MEVVPIHYDIGSHGLPGMGLSDQQRTYVRHFDPINAEDTMVFCCCQVCQTQQLRYKVETFQVESVVCPVAVVPLFSSIFCSKFLYDLVSILSGNVVLFQLICSPYHSNPSCSVKDHPMATPWWLLPYLYWQPCHSLFQH